MTMTMMMTLQPWPHYAACAPVRSPGAALEQALVLVQHPHDQPVKLLLWRELPLLPLPLLMMMMLQQRLRVRVSFLPRPPCARCCAQRCGYHDAYHEDSTETWTETWTVTATATAKIQMPVDRF